MGWETGTKREFKFDPNSTENEGRWRLYDPKKVDGYFRRKSSTAGVSYVMGKAGGETVIQAVRFDKDKFTEAEASKWWTKNHGRENLVFSDERKKASMNRFTKIASKLAGKVINAFEPNILDSLGTMSAVARHLGYRLDSTPMVITGIGTTWAMRSQRDWLEIQVTLEYNNQVSVDILPLDEDMQDELASEQQVQNVTSVNELISIIKRARQKALTNPLLRHLKLESTF